MSTVLLLLVRSLQRRRRRRGRKRTEGLRKGDRDRSRGLMMMMSTAGTRGIPRPQRLSPPNRRPRAPPHFSSNGSRTGFLATATTSRSTTRFPHHGLRDRVRLRPRARPRPSPRPVRDTGRFCIALQRFRFRPFRPFGELRSYPGTEARSRGRHQIFVRCLFGREVEVDLGVILIQR